jgi:hypothetical protein
MFVDRSMLVLLNDAPDRNTKSGKESKHRPNIRVKHKPQHAFVPNLPLRMRNNLVDIQVRSTFETSEFDGEHETDEGETLVWSCEDPGLHGAAGGGESGRPAPEGFVELGEEEHEEGCLEKVVQVGEVRGEDEDLRVERRERRSAGGKGREEGQRMTYAAEGEHERVDVGEDDDDQREDRQQSLPNRLSPRRERHHLRLFAAKEPTKAMSGPKGTETVNHHRVNLRRISRLRHSPLKDFIDLVNLEPSPEKERFTLAIVDPRIGREATDLREGGAAEEEAGAGVRGGFGGGVER